MRLPLAKIEEPEQILNNIQEKVCHPTVFGLHPGSYKEMDGQVFVSITAW